MVLMKGLDRPICIFSKHSETTNSESPRFQCLAISYQRELYSPISPSAEFSLQWFEVYIHNLPLLLSVLLGIAKLHYYIRGEA